MNPFKTIRKFSKPFAVVTVFTFVIQLFTPMVSFAITGYDSMPEYNSFEPVATTNMVNNFDGSLTYNIPIMNVPNGYPINLAYHSGDVSTESMASWVGFGWNINPGTINRNKRGFADDWKGESVTYHNKTEANWTVSADVGATPDVFSSDLINSLLNVNVSTGVAFNNYRGFSSYVSAGFSAAGVVNMDLSYAGGKFGFTPSINPVGIFNTLTRSALKSTQKNKSTGDIDKKVEEATKALDKVEKSGVLNNDIKDKAAKLNTKLKGSTEDQNKFMRNTKTQGTSFSLSNVYARTGFPTVAPEYTGIISNLEFSAGPEIFPIPVDVKATIYGKFARQENNKMRTRNVYGYLYNEAALTNENNMMDYFKENDQPYENRSKVVGYPLPNNDMYTQSGEAMGGNFRPYRAEFGHYRPDRMFSQEFGIVLGVDVKTPLGLTPIPNLLNIAPALGGKIGGDYHSTSSGDWNAGKRGQSASFDFETKDEFTNSRENFFFRYGGDKGGNYDLSGSDAAFRSDVGGGVDMSGWGGTDHAPDTRKNKQRSTYVDYSTNEEVSKMSNGFRYKAYDKKTRFVETLSNGNKVVSNVQYSTAGPEADKIAEYTTLNPDGVRYVYGLPVQVKNETQLSYNLEAADFNPVTLENKGGGIIAFPKANRDIEGNSRKLGYEAAGQYASTYLLTEISDPDYVDRKMDGPTPDDFGNYTKFNYERLAGGSNWFNYRTPYEGVNFNNGTLSSRKDDMGSFTAGEKEVYYLNSVVSKTHVAIFTLEDRDDGVEAWVGPNSDANELIRGEPSAAGDNRTRLKRLKKIDLYAIENVDEIASGAGFYEPKVGALPIKTANFEYDYELSSGLPNNVNNEGKLTLKKIYFEYEGKRTFKISPYFFHYEYPQDDDDTQDNYVKYPFPYDRAPQNLLASTTGLTENPSYSYTGTNSWSKYRDYAGLQQSLGNLARFWPYVNQNPEPTYDPAAWALKRIELPSGGEIHIQYEQHDYQYVQDQRAMVMVPLTGDYEDDGQNRNFLNLERIGISESEVMAMSTLEKEAFVRDLFAPMIEERRRIFFHYLYSMIGNETPNFRNNKSEYIEGYARIQGYGIASNGRVFFVFEGNTGDLDMNNDVYEEVDYGDKDVSRREIPRRVCRDFYNGQRRGLITGASNALSGEEGSENLLRTFITALSSLTTFNSCAKVNASMSYVRVQMPLEKSKLGGGFRVKRILTYDDGVVDEDPNSLYGQEFDYTTTETRGSQRFTISSGVATNEPATGRRENALVNPIDKEAPKGFGAFLQEPSILFGRDMYANEGPIGESVMPSPSIGYGKVTIRNIHKGQTSTGREECEFYTVKDFPFTATSTDVDQSNTLNIGAGGGAGGFGLSYSRKAPYISQGYSFINFSMHGQPKEKRKYAHLATDPMAKEVYEYYNVGDQMTVIDENKQVRNVPFSFFGKEAEILAERSQVYDFALQASGTFDVTTGAVVLLPPLSGLVPITFPVALPTSFGIKGSVTENLLHKHVTTKNITYPAILKTITNTADGVTNITENVAFDIFTGEPCVVRSRDDFFGDYLNYDFKASWDHPNMRSVALNTRLTSRAEYSVTGDGEFLIFPPTDCNETDKFTRGDLIELTQGVNLEGLYHVDRVEPGKLTIVRSGMSSPPSINSGVVIIEIIRSGYTNELSKNQGNLMTYNPNSGEVLNRLGQIAASQPEALQLMGLSNRMEPILNKLLEHSIDLNSSVFANNIPSDITYLGSTLQSIGLNYERTPLTNGDIDHSLSFSLVRTGTLPVINISFSYTTRLVDVIGGLGCVIDNLVTTCGAQTTFPSGGVIVNINAITPSTDGYIQLGETVLSSGAIEGRLTFFPYTSSRALDCEIPDDLCSIDLICSDVGPIFEVPAPSTPLLAQVVTASATTYFDNWAYNPLHYIETDPADFNGNVYEDGTRGNWRAKHQYVFRENINNSGEELNKEEGTFSLEAFDWDHVLEQEELQVYEPTNFTGVRYNPTNDDNTENTGFDNQNLWLLTTSITKYNPNGDVIEDKNILDVFSTSKYVDNQTLPGLVAQNAQDHTVAFESFENGYGSDGVQVVSSNPQFLEDGLAFSSGATLTESFSHTGVRSLRLGQATNFQIANLEVDDRSEYTNGEVQVRAWFRTAAGTALDDQLSIVYGTANNEMIMTKEASSGEWELYEARIRIADLTTTEITDGITVSIRSQLPNVYMDDARIQPLQSEMVCYVYDDAQRIVAVLDDWHFAMIYEYNPEGILVRKIKETVRGLKTVSETQYNSKGILRTD